MVQPRDPIVGVSQLPTSRLPVALVRAEGNIARLKEFMAVAEDKFDLARTVLSVLFLGALIGATFWILRPFLGAVVWAAVIVVATWPLMLACQRRLFGRRMLAVVVMTLALLLALVLPVTLAISTLVVNAPVLMDWAQSLSSFYLSPAPEWLGRVPLLGESLVSAWQQLSQLDSSELLGKASPYATDVLRWLAAHVGSLGLVLAQFLLTVLVAAIVYANGEEAARWTLQFGHRLAGRRGEESVRLAAHAIRGVALGVLVTALIQALLTGIGLGIARIPFAGVLTAAAFLLTVAQIGPLLVLVPAVIWLFATGRTGTGIFLLVWTVLVSTVDNFVRPWLIKRGVDLPLLLIFTGVIGGLIAFGVIGIFLGPVVLAVGWTLLGSWLAEERT